jgi:hypothetical protein
MEDLFIQVIFRTNPALFSDDDEGHHPVPLMIAKFATVAHRLAMECRSPSEDNSIEEIKALAGALGGEVLYTENVIQTAFMVLDAAKDPAGPWAKELLRVGSAGPPEPKFTQKVSAKNKSAGKTSNTAARKAKKDAALRDAKTAAGRKSRIAETHDRHVKTIKEARDANVAFYTEAGNTARENRWVDFERKEQQALRDQEKMVEGAVASVNKLLAIATAKLYE